MRKVFYFGLDSLKGARYFINFYEKYFKYMHAALKLGGQLEKLEIYCSYIYDVVLLKDYEVKAVTSGEKSNTYL